MRDNIILALQADRGWFRPIPRKRQDELAASYIEALNIKTPNADALVREYERVCHALEADASDEKLLKNLDDLTHQMNAANAWEYR